MRRAPSSRFRVWLHVVAALALGLFAGDHVLPALHYALVAHEMCPEHGQLEHAGAGARAHARNDGAPVVSAAADSEHHEHCGSVPASPPRAPLATGAVGALGVAPIQREVVVSPRAAVVAADVVAFAPKQSPPA